MNGNNGASNAHTAVAAPQAATAVPLKPAIKPVELTAAIMLDIDNPSSAIAKAIVSIAVNAASAPKNPSIEDNAEAPETTTTNAPAAAPSIDTKPPKGPPIIALMASPKAFKTLPANCIAGTSTGSNTSPANLWSLPLAISICSFNPSHEFL